MNNMKKLLAAVLALVMVLGLLAGCGGGGETQPSGDSQSVDGTGEAQGTQAEFNGEPQYGGHLNLHIYAKPTGLDPCEQTGIWKYMWTTCVWENVLTRDADNNIAPGVCEYELAPDNLSIKLWVRENCYFNDGTPVTIEDVEASLKRHFTGFAANAKKYCGDLIDTMTVDGDVLTITFKYYHEKTLYYLAAYQTWLGIMPKHIAEKYAEAPILDQIEDAIGTGPYKVVDYQDGVQITIARNEHYVPVEEGRTGFAAPKMAYLDTITFWYNSSNANAEAALLEGSYDMTDVVNARAQEEAYSLGIVREVHDSIVGTTIIFNTYGSNICAKYPDLRKAIMAAIDYEEFLSVVTDGCQILGGSMCYDPEYDTDAWENADYFGEANQDVVDQYLEAARAAGYKDQPVQIVYNTTRDDIPDLLCDYLDDADINYELTTMEQSVYNSFIGDPGNNWDFYFGWPNYGYTPIVLQDLLLKTNYKSEAKDALIAELEQLEEGSDEYVAKWQELAQQMVDDCATAHMGTIDWIWYHPAELHTNDEGLVRYVYNCFWEDPENHPSPSY